MPSHEMRQYSNRRTCWLTLSWGSNHGPYGMGETSGKWLEPVRLLQYPVMYPQVLILEGAVSPAAASPVAVGQKRPSDKGNGKAKEELSRRWSEGTKWKGRVVPQPFTLG